MVPELLDGYLAVTAYNLMRMAHLTAAPEIVAVAKPLLAPDGLVELIQLLESSNE